MIKRPCNYRQPALMDAAEVLELISILFTSVISLGR